MNIIATFEEGHRVVFLAARMMGSAEDKILSNFQTWGSHQTYQCCIRAAKYLLQCPDVPNTIDYFDGEGTKQKKLGI